VEANNSCNPDGRPEGEVVLGDTTDDSLYAKPLKPGTTEDLPNGLLGMACGTPYDTLFLFTFLLDTTAGHWGLNFNPRGQPGESDALEIVRTSLRSWRISASSTQRAVLLGFGHRGTKGNNGASREGQYLMPFEVEVTAPEGVTVPPCGS
jgi:hypothetical protein